MSLRNSTPIPFAPSGVTDAVDGSNAPAGSMAALVNLIPDPSTKGVFTCRPAAEELTDFEDFSSPAFIPVFHVIGTLVYGMVGSALSPGRDQPFCYDTSTDTFVPVTGTQDATTLPLSQATSGEWTPPTMDLIGALLIVTHPGFPGGGGAFFGWFDVSTPAAPVWHAGNTSSHALAAVPTAVAQFNGRAWYAVADALVFSDALAATTVTNSSQAITVATSEPFTALAGLPLSTMISGGVIQALLAFKGVSIIYQVTGDATTNNLDINALNVATGTLAPNTLTPTPKGMAFISPQGLRFIDFQMNISPPVGVAGTGVAVPFLYAQDPSRMCAAYNADVIRISCQNGKAPGAPFQEWWYDLPRGIWTGPHTFPASFTHAFTHPTGEAHPSFIMAPQGVLGALFDSHAFPPLSPVFVENGVTMSFDFATSILPDTYQMSESSIVEQTVNLALPSGLTLTALMQDTEGTVLGESIALTNTSSTIWGAFVWGAAIWRGGFSHYRPWQLQWGEGITFRMAALKLTGDCAADFQVGTVYSRFNILGYLQQESP